MMPKTPPSRIATALRLLPLWLLPADALAANGTSPVAGLGFLVAAIFGLGAVCFFLWRELLRERGSRTPAVTAEKEAKNSVSLANRDPLMPSELYSAEAQIDRAFGEWGRKLFPDLLRLHARLERYACRPGRPLRLNEPDGIAYMLHRDAQLSVFGVECAALKFVVFLRGNGKGLWELHLRRVWDELTTDAISDDLQNQACQIGLQFMVRLAPLAERYSDRVEGNNFINRPDLELYRATGFACRNDDACSGLIFGDARDAGYLLSIRSDAADPSGLTGPNYRLLRQALHFLAAISRPGVGDIDDGGPLV